MPDSFLTPRIGHITSGQTSVNVGFQPDYVEFQAIRHPAGFNSEFYSGSNNSPECAYGWSYGIAGSPAEGNQFVHAFASGSSSVNGHHSYVGDGEVVHVITAESDGTEVQGRTTAKVESFDSNGMTLSWPSNYDDVVVLYRAYSTEAIR